MIRLASIIDQFEADFLADYGEGLLPSQRQALAAIKNCRGAHSPLMRVSCADCDHTTYLPHSCGHRSCPHCQNHEGEQWIERQTKKRLPVDYFMLTFTLPRELRALAFSHQRLIYALLFECVWETLSTFSLNDKQLQGTPGMVAVLHTHSRRLDFHPHIHAILPAGAIDKKQRLWRKKDSGYLFNHKALAKVFRAKMLAEITKLNLVLPAKYPKEWVVDCKKVGSGDKAFVYLGRYLYRGVILEKHILSTEKGMVTFRYQDSKTKRYKTRTLPGKDFIKLILQHVLPRRFRRSRDYGFLHPNSKSLIKLLHYLLKFKPSAWAVQMQPRAKIPCPCCGAAMQIVQTRIKRMMFISSTVSPAIAGGSH